MHPLTFRQKVTRLAPLLLLMVAVGLPGVRHAGGHAVAGPERSFQAAPPAQEPQALVAEDRIYLRR